MKIEIKKPLHGTYCGIRDKAIEQAIKYNEPLEIHLPQGVAIMDAKEWKKTGKRIEKKYLYDTPMILYFNYAKIKPSEEVERMEYQRYLL